MASLNENLTRLSTARSNIATAISDMGGTVTANDGFEDFPADIRSISSGMNETVFTNVTQPSSPTYNKIYYNDSILAGALRGYISYSLYGSSYVTMFTIPNITSLPTTFYLSFVNIGSGTNVYPTIFYNNSGYITVKGNTYGYPDSCIFNSNGCSIQYQQKGSSSYFTMGDAIIQVYAVF